MGDRLGFMPIGAEALEKKIKSHFYLDKYFLLVAQQFIRKIRIFFQTHFKLQNDTKC